MHEYIIKRRFLAVSQTDGFFALVCESENRHHKKRYKYEGATPKRNRKNQALAREDFLK
jgi:hypothetical protein